MAALFMHDFDVEEYTRRATGPRDIAYKKAKKLAGICKALSKMPAIGDTVLFIGLAAWALPLELRIALLVAGGLVALIVAPFGVACGIIGEMIKCDAQVRWLTLLCDTDAALTKIEGVDVREHLSTYADVRKSVKTKRIVLLAILFAVAGAAIALVSVFAVRMAAGDNDLAILIVTAVLAISVPVLAYIGKIFTASYAQVADADDMYLDRPLGSPDAADGKND